MQNCQHFHILFYIYYKMSTVKGYKKHKVIDNFGDNCTIYEATKADKKFWLYEFDSMGEAEIYNFKILNKIMSSAILAVVEQFQ